MEQKRRTILIVDDMELNRAILNEMFYQNYNVLEACDGEQALQLISQKKHEIDIILLDIVMPVIDGFGVLESLQRQNLLERLPVVMITAENSESVMKKGYAMGVTDIITKPFNPDIVRRRVKNVLALYSRQESLEELVEQQTQALRSQTRQLLDALSSIIEFKNMESGQHILRIRIITKFLLQKLSKKFPGYNLTAKQIDTISEAAAMHDIGKIAISNSILNKPGKLTSEEFEIMKTHTVKGCEVARKLKYIQSQDFMGYCLDICRHHHERWDGRGYPDGLQGDEISIWAQVVSLADVYDALTSVRVYKPAYSHQEAIQMILNGECGTFNPKLLKCFTENADEMYQYLLNLTDENASTFGYEDEYQQKTTANMTNISDRTLQLLELEREKYRIITELSGDIVFDYDTQRDFISFSEKFREVFGGNIIIEDARHWIQSSEFLYGQDKNKFIKHLMVLTSQNVTCKVQVRLMVNKDTYEWFDVYIHSIWNQETGECLTLMGKMVNVDQRYKELEQWKKVANTDGLTGLYNRKALEEKISEVLMNESSQQSALCFIDLDDFKQVNDGYGHPYGDELLIEIARQLKGCVRSTDITGRIGGDEFIVLLRGIKSIRDMIEKASQLCHTLGKGFKGYDYSVSIGIAVFPEAGKTYEELLSRADQALYCSKNAGKDQYVIYGEDTAEMPFRSLLSEVDSFVQTEDELAEILNNVGTEK